MSKHKVGDEVTIRQDLDQFNFTTLGGFQVSPAMSSCRGRLGSIISVNLLGNDTYYTVHLVGDQYPTYGNWTDDMFEDYQNPLNQDPIDFFSVGDTVELLQTWNYIRAGETLIVTQVNRSSGIAVLELIYNHYIQVMTYNTNTELLPQIVFKNHTAKQKNSLFSNVAVTPHLIKPSEPQVCIHNPKEYFGLNERYNYCTVCGIKL